MINRSQIEKMLMASGGITGEPVQTARIGSYMRSTGGGKGPAGMTRTERVRNEPVVNFLLPPKKSSSMKWNWIGN